MKKTNFIYLIVLLVFGVVLACQKDPGFDSNYPYILDYGGLTPPAIPADNPLRVEGVKLGRMLFYEPKLSGNNSMSCASCHNQKTAFSDTNRFSLGIKGHFGGRQAMAVFNLAWNTNEFFWDGRAASLREQSLKPIQDPVEMDESLANVVEKLKSDSRYLVQFRKAFGSDEITELKISLALEQFMHSIVSHQSKYDAYLAGKATLTAEEERGRYLFFTEYNPGFPATSGADCQHCHSGPNFTDNRYHNNGLDSTNAIQDVGREKVTNNPMDKGKFRTTSLRNIALTPPYMHDGRFRTLEEVVEHYNLVHASSTLDPTFYQQLPKGLELTASDKAALVAFLQTLTDQNLISDPRYSDPFLP